jgi:predicted acetyltransferase
MAERAELVAPSLRHARSYVAALRERFRRGSQERASEERIRQIEADFAAYLQAITDRTGSIRLPTGQVVPKVPFSVFWLVEGDEFIGETQIRHELNDYLIKEGGHVGYGIRPERQRQGYGKLILRWRSRSAAGSGSAACWSPACSTTWPRPGSSRRTAARSTT